MEGSQPKVFCSFLAALVLGFYRSYVLLVLCFLQSFSLRARTVNRKELAVFWIFHFWDGSRSALIESWNLGLFHGSGALVHVWTCALGKFLPCASLSWLIIASGWPAIRTKVIENSEGMRTTPWAASSDICIRTSTEAQRLSVKIFWHVSNEYWASALISLFESPLYSNTKYILFCF